MEDLTGDRLILLCHGHHHWTLCGVDFPVSALEDELDISVVGHELRLCTGTLPLLRSVQNVLVGYGLCSGDEDEEDEVDDALAEAQ